MPNSKHPIKRVRPACGTWLEITLPHDDPASHAAAFAEAARLERIFSAHDPASEVSAMNRGEIPVVAVSEELSAVLALGEQIEAQSAGAFRMRDAQGRLDLGGIAKGAIVDRVFEMLAARIPSGPLLVNAGGDLRVRGAHDIEIRVPTAEGAELRYGYCIQDAALATSSLLQGPVGQASAKYSQDRRAVTTASVLAPTASEADALTKAVIFSSTPDWVRDSVAVLTFDDRGRALSG